MAKTPKPRFRKNYERERLQIATSGPSMAKQAFAADCDINNIMKQFERTGALTHANQYEGNYGDFTNTPDSYHNAMNIITSANEMFASVPAKIRDRFHNDPQRFLNFVSDPANKSEMLDMGLIRNAEQTSPGASAPSAGTPAPAQPSEGSTAAPSATAQASNPDA